MKKNISILVSIVVLTLGFTACKKYEDGPTFSLATKKGRVANEWTLVECKRTASDGTVTDFTHSTQQLYAKVKLTKDGDFTFTSSNGNQWASGSWDFEHKKETLVFTFSDGTAPWTVEITRLKQKEFWVKENSADETVLYKFEEN